MPPPEVETEPRWKLSPTATDPPASDGLDEHDQNHLDAYTAALAS
jgi:hypothetical protein